MAIIEGAKAPNFSLPDQDGKMCSLSEYKGQYVVIYFYPKDATPGCTKEACTFRDNIAVFTAKSCVVLGVSKDDAKSHQKFIAKYELPFSLLTDEVGSMLEDYSAWGEKSMYGKKYMGIVRSTVLIGPDGKVLKHWASVSGAEHHPLEVLEFLNSI